ncbi:MAG TPA: hypothetical protein VG869_16300 [Acidimicrobiia bacterium]|jgi:hypothetical protein|nr:hypothetical protein [Acidimicrobiia bacterium]
MADQEIAGVDTQAIEHEITRLPGVVACRIVADSLGRPLEVHVLAHPGKHPKQVVRDVQSVALASFGVDIDRRIVSVVQLGPTGESPGELPKPDLARTTIGAIQSQVDTRRATIRITLSSGDLEATGYAEGSAASATRLRLVASATLDALRQLHDGAQALEVEDASVARVGSHDVVAVTLIHLDPPHEFELVGAALARQSPDLGAVRAVLDAVNRRLPYLPGDHPLA